MGAGQLVASLYGLLTLEDKMTPGLKQAAGNAEKFGGTTASATEKVTTLVGAMRAVPAAGFLVGAIAQAAQFDKTMTNVGAVLGKNKSQMTALNAEVLNIGKNSIAGPQAAAEAFYDIVGGVADASTHVAILNASIKASEAGNANLQATTQGLISVMNSYKLGASSASYVSDVLTQTVGKGVGTMDQFVSAIGPIAGLAASSGVSIKELATAMAFMTTKGTSAAQAATQSQAAITAMLKPNAAMDALLKNVKVSTEGNTAATGKWTTTTKAGTKELAGWNDELAKTQAQMARLSGKKNKDALDNYNLGKQQAKIAELQGKIAQGGQTVKYQQGAGAAQKVTTEWLIKTYGMVGALNKLKEAAGGSSQKMAEALGSTEALRAFVALTGQDWGEFSKDFDQGMKGATDRARDIQLTSVSAQFDLLKSNLAGVAIAAGNVLLPALSAVMRIFNGLIGLVNQFDPALLGIVAAFTALGIAVPALLPILGMLAGAVAPLLVPIAALTGAFVAVKAAWDTDLGGIRTNVTAFVNAVKPQIDQISAGIKAFFDVLNAPAKMTLDTEGMSDSAARLTKKLNKLDPNDGLTKAPELDFGTKLKNAIDTAWPMIEPALTTLIGNITKFGAKIVTDFVAGIVGLGQSVISKIQEELAKVDIGKEAANLLTNALTFGGKLVANILSGLTNIYTDLTAKISTIDAVDIGKQAAQLLINALKFGADLISNIVSGITGGKGKVEGQITTETSGINLITIGKGLLDSAMNFGTTLVGKIIEGLLGFATRIKDELESKFKGVNLIAAAKQLLDEAKKFGDKITGEIANGIVNTTVDVAGKVTTWLNGINWEKVGADVAKGAMAIGKSIIEGLFPPESNMGDKITGEVDKAAGNSKLVDAGKKLGKALLKAIGDALTGIGEVIAGKLMEEMAKNTPDWLLGLMGTNKAALSTGAKMLQNRTESSGSGGAQQTAASAATAPPPAAASAGTSAGAGAGAGVSVGQQAFIGQKADAAGGQPLPVTVQSGSQPVQIDASGKPVPVDVKSIAPNQQQGAQAGPPTPPGYQPPTAPQAPTAPAGAPPGAAGAAGGMNPVDITLQSVQQKLQEAIQWINTIGAVMLSEAMTAASTTAANAFKGGMASIPQAVILPVTMANLWVGTIGLAGAVGVFGALSKSAAGALTGIAAPIVAQVAEALIRIATMIAALPNGVGAQLAGQIRAAAGARAEGGPVGPGMWLVGEKGPELLQLGGGQHGQVISNKALRGASGGGNGSSGTTIILQNPVFQGVQDPETLLNKLQQVAGRFNLTVGTP